MSNTLDALMEQAQVFASAWSLVGGPFDDGNAMEDAEEARTELRSMLHYALSPALAARVPARWRMVPEEPTPEMCKAAVIFANGNTVYKNVAADALKIEEQIYGEAFAAMLAAAPPAPAEVPQPSSLAAEATAALAALEFISEGEPHDDPAIAVRHANKAAQRLRIALGKEPPAEVAAEPVAHVLFRQDEDGLEPVMFYGPGTAPDPAGLKDRFVLRDVWLSPPAPQKSQAPKWRPIETAPRETEVLVGRWCGGEWRICQSGLHYDSGNAMAGEPPGGWYWHSDWDNGGVTEEPDAWMPLPSAPSMGSTPSPDGSHWQTLNDWTAWGSTGAANG